MVSFASLASLRSAFDRLPSADTEAARAVTGRQATLTKPPGSLGRLETLVAWLAAWQRRPMPRLDHVEILVFAGNHGVTRHAVSPYPSGVTAQMVANFNRGGAAINQLARTAGAVLRVVPLALDQPTGDITQEPAMTGAALLDAVNTGAASVVPGTDLLCLGEMGIGNTTISAALCAACFGEAGAAWVGRGTGVDDAGLRRKADVVDRALDFHHGHLDDPLEALRRLGGRELAAIFGAVLAARLHGVPVLIDGFSCTAALVHMTRCAPDALDHAQIGHVSAESAHRRLVERLGKTPLVDLDMRLGEGSGAAIGALLLRAALSCHVGMATFAQAGVSDRSPGGPPWT